MAGPALTQQEIEILDILSDPVKWIAATTGETPRWYQVEMLRDPKLRKVFRLGRRTGKTWVMCAHMLWYAFTHKNAALVVATPYENQITVIFDQLRKFIANAPEVSSSILIDRRNPQHIQLKNGSTIKGFTAGTRSGAAGGSLRGQRADYIYMDEVDYMTDDDFDTIYAISLEAPARIGVWVASTPTGRRGMFWNLCVNKDKGFKEYHYPSTVNPEWDPTMEKELRAMFSTEIAWQHEVLAEFGEEVVGVFKKEYIDRAKANYEYFTQRDKLFSHVTVGVDWDKYSAATQIVVTGFNVSLKQFQVINRFEIPRSEFTLNNAIQKIIRINEDFNPDFIYIDRGFGEYQMEVLHIYGRENPTTGLEKKVKGWQFGSSYEVRDPITKLATKQPLKPFMVNQLVYMTEQDKIILNEHDEMIWKQMENYSVVRINQSGQPIFTSEDEHSVDALMLSILAFQLEFPNLADIMKEQSVARKVLESTMQFVDPLKGLFHTSKRNNFKEPEWDEPGAPPPKRVPLGTGWPQQDRGWGPRGTSRRNTNRKSW